MSTLKLGEIKSRMLREVNLNRKGASLYRNEFGHIIAPLLLTQWPIFKRKQPVIFSDKHLCMMQLTELCYRMLVRCAIFPLYSLQSTTIHADNTISFPQLKNIEQRLFARMTQPSLYLPDLQGEKLTKAQALTWTYLYTVEMAHFIAEQQAGNNPDLINDPALWSQFKEEAAFILYCIACGDCNLMSRVDCMLNECLRLLDVCWVQMDIIRQTNYMYCYHREILEAFYDDFISHFNKIDTHFHSTLGQSLSQMSIEQLDQLSTEDFIGHEPLIKIIYGQDTIDFREYWRANIQYDEQRSLYLITRISAPERVLKIL